MGNDQSELAGQSFHRDDWHLLEVNPNVRLWANRRDPSFTIEQYEIFPQSEQQFVYEKDIYYLRKNSSCLVAALYLQNQEQGDFCSTNYRQRLFIEAIPIRLSDIEHIPFPDYIHLYNQALRGFQKLYKAIGYFSVEEELIGVNGKGIVKVWMNEQFEKSFALAGSSLTEEAMVRSIVELIDKNLLQGQQPNNVPTVLNFLYRNSGSLNFEGAVSELQNFVGKYNMGHVPERLACIDRVGGVSAILDINRNNVKKRKSSSDQNVGLPQPNGYLRPQLIEANLMKNSCFSGSFDKNPDQTLLSIPSNTLGNNGHRSPVMMCTSSVFNEQRLEEQLKNQQPGPRNPHNKFTIIQLLKGSNNFNKGEGQSFIHQDFKIPSIPMKNLQSQHASQPIKTLRQPYAEQTQNFQRQQSATDRVFNQATTIQRPVTKPSQTVPQQVTAQPSYKRNLPIRFVSSQPTLIVAQQNSPLAREVPIIPATFTPSLTAAQKNTIAKSFILQSKVEIPSKQLNSFGNDVDSPTISFSKREATRNVLQKETEIRLLKSQEPPSNYNLNGKNMPNPQLYSMPSYQTNNRSKQEISATYHHKVTDPIKYDLKGKQTASSSYNHLASDIHFNGKSSDDFMKQVKAVDSFTPSLDPSLSFKNPFENRQPGPSTNQQFNYQSLVPAKRTTDYVQPNQYRTLSYNYQTVSDANMATNYSLEDDEEFGRNVYSIIAPQLQLGSQVSSRSKKANGPLLKFERNIQMKYSVVRQEGQQHRSRFQGING